MGSDGAGNVGAAIADGGCKSQSKQHQLRSMHTCKLVREEGLVMMWMAGDLSVASSAVGFLSILLRQVLRHMGFRTHVSSFHGEKGRLHMKVGCMISPQRIGVLFMKSVHGWWHVGGS